MKKTSRLAILGELWAFMRVRKKWWLGPIVMVLLLLGLLLVFTQGSALAPFIYTLVLDRSKILQIPVLPVPPVRCQDCLVKRRDGVAQFPFGLR